MKTVGVVAGRFRGGSDLSVLIFRPIVAVRITTKTLWYDHLQYSLSLYL